MNYKEIIAVDFDGTLCEFSYPGFGKPNTRLIDRLKEIQDDVIMIMWTCRENQPLKDAVEWCEKQGLHFDYINENADQSLKQYGVDCRKILADVYIDDKSCLPERFCKQ